MSPGQTANESYHHSQKGCKIIESRKYTHPGDKYPMLILTCQLHQQKLCRCGWEFGKHPMAYDGTERMLVEEGIEIT